MRIKVIVLLTAVCLAGTVYGNEQEKLVETIRNSQDYVSSFGSGKTFAEADGMAIDGLVGQISMKVQSSFMEEMEENDNELHDRVKRILNTYSSATLNNALRIDGLKMVKGEPQYWALRYMKKSEIYKVFEERTQKLHEYVRLAKKAEKKRLIDDALRYCYWAKILLRTLPDENSLKTIDEDGDSVMLSTWIREEMHLMFRSLSVVKIAEKDDICELQFLYDKEPVSSVSYTYYDGMGESNINTARDGRGTVRFRHGVEHDKTLHIHFEYAFVSEMQHDREVKEAYASDRLTLRDANFNVELSESAETESVETGAVRISNTADIVHCDTTLMEVTDITVCRNAMTEILNAIQTKDYSLAKPYFTESGWDTFNKIINYGNAEIYGEVTPDSYVFLPYAGKIICRSIPMVFSFADNKRSFTENVTCTFNADGKIENLAFSLGQVAEKDILTKGVWSQPVRMAIMNFLEDYKTAYALKDSIYIESVLDNNAVMIVGKMVYRLETGDNGLPLNKKVVQYTQFTKNEYLKRLQKCFKSNEFINIRFSNNDVVKSKNGLYGIQIKQDYYSSTYGDTGYLFLAVDFENPETPRILLRSWQPEPNPDLGGDGLVSIYNFREKKNY